MARAWPRTPVQRSPRPSSWWGGGSVPLPKNPIPCSWPCGSWVSAVCAKMTPTALLTNCRLVETIYFLSLILSFPRLCTLVSCLSKAEVILHSLTQRIPEYFRMCKILQDKITWLVILFFCNILHILRAWNIVLWDGAASSLPTSQPARGSGGAL